MGSNRSGVRRTQRLKRSKKENERLTKKTAAKDGAPAKKGVVAKVTGAAKTAAKVVGAAAEGFVEGLKGKKETKEKKDKKEKK